MYSPQQGTVQRKAWGHVTSHPAQLSSALSLHPASQAASSLRPAPLQCPDSQAHRLPTLGLCLLGALQPLCQWTPALAALSIGRQGARRQVSTGCGRKPGKAPRGRRTGSTHIGNEKLKASNGNLDLMVDIPGPAFARKLLCVLPAHPRASSVPAVTCSSAFVPQS